jgi:hypothetical protein
MGASFDHTEYDAGITALDNSLDERRARVLALALPAVLDAAQPLTPYKTGRLRREQYVEVVNGVGRIVSPTPYAAKVHNDYDVEHVTGQPGFITGAVMSAGPRALLEAGASEILA